MKMLTEAEIKRWLDYLYKQVKECQPKCQAGGEEWILENCGQHCRDIVNLNMVLDGKLPPYDGI